jgi:AraC-like DNA-binding protein
MPHSVSRRGPSDAYDFEGVGDDARAWLDRAYGTSLRLSGPVGTVRHSRVDHGTVAFDHLRIDSAFSVDSDPMPALVVVDLIGGDSQYSREDITSRNRDGDSVLIAGWDMPFTNTSHGFEVRTTTLTTDAVTAAVEELVPDYPWQRISFSSYVPRTPSAGARWRATVDQLSHRAPSTATEQAETGRMLAQTLLETFPNNVMGEASRLDRGSGSRDATPSLVRNAMHIMEVRAYEDLKLDDLARACGVSPRALQYAFRRHLDCTPMDYLRRVRLDLVRRSLREGSAPSVTDAAARFGFFNPGRFASSYREVFDENPRETFQRASS